MFGNQQIQKNSLQAARSALATVVTPSHVVSQVVAFPGDILTVFPVQGEHKSPFLKYPARQSVTVKNTDLWYILSYYNFVLCISGYHSEKQLTTICMISRCQFNGVSRARRTRRPIHEIPDITDLKKRKIRNIITHYKKAPFNKKQTLSVNLTPTRPHTLPITQFEVFTNAQN